MTLVEETLLNDASRRFSCKSRVLLDCRSTQSVLHSLSISYIPRSSASHPSPQIRNPQIPLWHLFWTFMPDIIPPSFSTPQIHSAAPTTTQADSTACASGMTVTAYSCSSTDSYIRLSQQLTSTTVPLFKHTTITFTYTPIGMTCPVRLLIPYIWTRAKCNESGAMEKVSIAVWKRGTSSFSRNDSRS